MGVSSQLCTILLLICILFIYNKQLYIRTESNKVFERMVYLLLLSSLLTVLIYILNGSMSYSSKIMFNFALRIFEISIVLYVFSIRDYVFHWIHVKISPLSYVLRIAISLAICACPVNVEIVENEYLFSMRGMRIAIFVVFAVTLYTCFVTYRRRAYASKVLLTSFSVWMFLFSWSFVLNSLFNIDLFAFSCAIGSLWLFYNMENPKSKVDDTSGFFTSHVILDYLDSLPTQMAHIGIIYTHDNYLDVGLLKSLLKNKKIYCFKDTDNFYFLVANEFDMLMDILNQYREQYDVIVLTYKNATSDIISTLSHYVKQEVMNMKESVIAEVSEEDINKLTEANHMHMEIVSALMEDRIETFIQPIYSIKDHMFTSGECLCRLRGKDGNLVMPYAFIPIAERTGLITEIETAMFRNMCKCLAHENVKASSIQYLEANLSIKKGEQHDLMDEYANIISEYGIDSGKVNLEITETDVVEEKLSILSNIHAMKSMGFNFSLDDFGTGESNLGYIIDMPVSIIKFDKEITQKAMNDNRAFTIVSNVINMAHELNIKVVVEGVETKDDYERCKDMNADYIQGYYFSKPLPMDEFIRFINAKHNFE